MFPLEPKPYNDHTRSPAISIYIVDEEAAFMEKISCFYCKRTIADIKGQIDRVVTIPMPLEDFGLAVNIRCKLCHQNYRFLVNAQMVQV